VEPGSGPGSASRTMIEADIRKFGEAAKAANLN
jgi:hypothetical protein